MCQVDGHDACVHLHISYHSLIKYIRNPRWLRYNNNYQRRSLTICQHDVKYCWKYNHTYCKYKTAIRLLLPL